MAALITPYADAVTKCFMQVLMIHSLKNSQILIYGGLIGSGRLLIFALVLRILQILRLLVEIALRNHKRENNLLIFCNVFKEYWLVYKTFFK